MSAAAADAAVAAADSGGWRVPGLGEGAWEPPTQKVPSGPTVKLTLRSTRVSNKAFLSAAAAAAEASKADDDSGLTMEGPGVRPPPTVPPVSACRRGAVAPETKPDGTP